MTTMNVRNDAEFSIFAPKKISESIIHEISDFTTNKYLFFQGDYDLDAVSRNEDEIAIIWWFYNSKYLPTLDEDLTAFLTSLIERGCTIEGGITRSYGKDNLWGLRMVNNKVKSITGEIIWTVD